MLNHTPAKYLLTIALLVILLYGTFVFRHVFHRPEITLNQELFIETADPTLTISGSVKHLSSLTVNAKPLLFEQTGYFEQKRTLPEGTSTIILEGTDRFGRESEVIVTVNKTPADFVVPPLEEIVSDEESEITEDDSDNAEEIPSEETGSSELEDLLLENLNLIVEDLAEPTLTPEE